MIQPFFVVNKPCKLRANFKGVTKQRLSYATESAPKIGRFILNLPQNKTITKISTTNSTLHTSILISNSPSSFASLVKKNESEIIHNGHSSVFSNFYNILPLWPTSTFETKDELRQHHHLLSTFSQVDIYSSIFLAEENSSPFVDQLVDPLFNTETVIYKSLIPKGQETSAEFKQILKSEQWSYPSNNKLQPLPTYKFEQYANESTDNLVNKTNLFKGEFPVIFDNISPVISRFYIQTTHDSSNEDIQAPKHLNLMSYSTFYFNKTSSQRDDWLNSTTYFYSNQINISSQVDITNNSTLFHSDNLDSQFVHIYGDQITNTPLVKITTSTDSFPSDLQSEPVNIYSNHNIYSPHLNDLKNKSVPLNSDPINHSPVSKISANTDLFPPDIQSELVNHFSNQNTDSPVNKIITGSALFLSDLQKETINAYSNQNTYSPLIKIVKNSAFFPSNLQSEPVNVYSDKTQDLSLIKVIKSTALFPSTLQSELFNDYSNQNTNLPVIKITSNSGLFPSDLHGKPLYVYPFPKIIPSNYSTLVSLANIKQFQNTREKGWKESTHIENKHKLNENPKFAQKHNVESTSENPKTKNVISIVRIVSSVHVSFGIPPVQNTITSVNKEIKPALHKVTAAIKESSHDISQVVGTEHSKSNTTCVDYLEAEGQHKKCCDGIVDCWDYSDEVLCNWCSAGQFVCQGAKMCISNTSVCDGFQDCPFGTDEKNCLKLAAEKSTVFTNFYQKEGYVLVQKQGTWGKLCVENMLNISWEINELGQALCQALSYRFVTSIIKTKDIHPWGLSYFEVDLSVSEAEILMSSSGHTYRSTLCKTRDVIYLSCSNLECGVRPLSQGIQGRVIGGQSSMVGAWPWQVALYREGEFQCGAVLINNQWLVSAGHCFYRSPSAYWAARLGLLRRGTRVHSPFEQVRRISHVIIHPDYVDKGFINDISLLSDYVRPVCLPSPEDAKSQQQGQMCTVTGWGKLFEIGQIFPDTLQEVQLPMISTEECRKKTFFLPLYQITDNVFCAGYDRGGQDACLGDSGGPLMCPNSNRHWTLTGVTSNGDGCGRPGRPGVYTKVVNYLQWINSLLAQPFSLDKEDQCIGKRCPLGLCLTKDKICDGTKDCRDGSDELHCVMSV
ncbi:serine protease nudel-like isoform X2 [Limulus polyphemus]|uniref:Serine protease nudel-like isoform X2 n=1 Tax=Limulus polyphemus TaxID=6850 RepID=A0ABM1SMY3_LIMPO|nr:serine protease nudel-like isoform X2 [Limulus polyphemus]